MALSAKTKRFLDRNCPVSLSGKTVLITGASSGIGLKTAETMLYLGAMVILACRNPEKAAYARTRLQADYPGAVLRIMQLDLADFRSIEEFASHLPDVDVFINNAGMYHRPGQKTADGLQLITGVNYFGTWYLTEKVLPLLKQSPHPVVLINTVSIVQKTARVNYSRFFEDRGSYSRSKLCLARYSCSLAESCRNTNIRVYMSHPGIAVTAIASHLIGKLMVLAPVAPFNTVEKSSLSAAWILSHNLPDGSLVGPRGLLNIWGYPSLNRPCKKAKRGIVPLLDFTRKTVEEKISSRKTGREQQLSYHG